jgi:hypothetical protein
MKKSKKFFEWTLNETQERICWPTWRNADCIKQKCFTGIYNAGTEIDAIIIRDKDFCLMEYEHKRKDLCENFMKMHWLQKLLNKQFESLFITELSTRRQPDLPTTFDGFNAYVKRIKVTLDILLKDWSVLELVDVGRLDKKHFYWQPELNV